MLQALLASAGLATAGKAYAQHDHSADPEAPGRPGDLLGRVWRSRAGIVPVETPDLPKMPWRMENGVKVFHIVAEPVRAEFLPGRKVDVWGFNGSMPGPTIEVNQGDRVRFVVENRLPEVFSMHWHGFEVPIEMDGVPGISQDPIPPGGKFVYEFTLHQHGTFFYHSHMAMQEMMGMIGLFIMHPREPYRPRVDRDFGLIVQEWAILPNNTVPNTLSMEFNWLTINGKAGPATTPLLVKLGERVRIRMVNLGMDHHPMHLHGNTFYTTMTEGGRIPKAAWEPGNTVLLGVAQARAVEFDAIYPGDWMLHCHLPHHMMNQMVSMVGPMAHVGSGLHTGLSMQEGMGIIRGGHALSERNGPSLGRTIGTGSEFEKPVTNLAGQDGMAHDSAMPGMQHGSGERDLAPVAPNARQVPGYPQDMFMVMDEKVAKPETWGLRPSWTGGMMGMMTLVRVLKPETYDHIQKLRVQTKEATS
ncbi:MAG: multicopper oxidase family protein [Thermoanaerobaculia bacterium]